MDVTCWYPKCTNTNFNMLGLSRLAVRNETIHECDICSCDGLRLCEQHVCVVNFICPNYIDHNYPMCLRELKEFLPDNFRYSIITGYTYVSNKGDYIVLRLEDDIYVEIYKRRSCVLIYNRGERDYLYWMKSIDKSTFLEEYEQYTYKPILDSLKANGYINILPRDITGIIRTFL